MSVHKSFVYWIFVNSMVYQGYTQDAQNFWECYTNRDTASWDWRNRKSTKQKESLRIPKFCTEEKGWLNFSAVNATVHGKEWRSRRQSLELRGPRFKAPEGAANKHRGLFACQDCEAAWHWWLYFLTSSHLLNQISDNCYLLPVIMHVRNNLGLLKWWDLDDI